MKEGLIERCRICRGTDLFTYLDLGRQPPSNSFLPPDRIPEEMRFPLAVALCRDCGLSQLTYVVPAKSIFDEYAYLSSTSKALCAHYQKMVDSLCMKFRPDAGALVVDIGCNDGITLACYPGGIYRPVGVEPSSAGAHAVAKGFEVVKEFFGRTVARKMVERYGKAKLVTVTNVFAHVDDIHEFTGGIAALLDVDGVCCFEFPYIDEMLHGLYFDTVYHEHLSYLGLSPLLPLFDAVGLKAIAVERQSVGASGPALRLCVARADSAHPIEGSIRAIREKEAVWIREPGRYVAFAERVAAVRNSLLTIIDSLCSTGKKIGAYGAPAKGNTLLNYLGLDRGRIAAVAENSPIKIGLLTPGTHIPIVDDNTFLGMGISHALLLSWNYADFFISHSDFIRSGGKFIVPLPEPRIAP